MLGSFSLISFNILAAFKDLLETTIQATAKSTDGVFIVANKFLYYGFWFVKLIDSIRFIPLAMYASNY